MLLGSLDEGQDVAHPEDPAGKPVGVEELEGVGLLAGAQELDRDASDRGDRERRAATGIAVDRGDLKRTEAIIRAMTRAERNDPNLLNSSRRRRIAAGSGTTLPDVNRLVKQFTEMQKLTKQLSGGGKRAAIGALTGRR